MGSSKFAMDHPSGDLVVLSRSQVEETLVASRNAPRRRMIRPYHRDQEDPMHRMLNAIQPGSYARPHRHSEPPKAECWIVLQGSLLFVSFFDTGEVDETVVLKAGGECFGVDLVPGRYHTVCALEPDTVIYEVKTGPYSALTDKAFAPWSPAEGSLGVSAFLARLISLVDPKLLSPEARSLLTKDPDSV